MTQFMMVHGGFHGGWCWKRVVPLLRAAGHDVWTPTLTGLGERAHLATDSTDLSTHIRDVVAVLEMEELEDVVLVGHSYGGMVITGAAEQAHERIRRLVYLDGMVPRPDSCALEMMGGDLSGRLSATGAGEAGQSIPPPEFFGVLDPEDADWLRRLLTSQPPKSFTERLPLPEKRAERLPRTYIHCTDPMMVPPGRFLEKLKVSPDWRFHTLATGHDAMISDPQGLAEILVREADV